MSVIKETVTQFAAAQAEREAAASQRFAGKNKPKHVPTATITSASQVEPSKQTKRKLESATEGPAPKRSGQLFKVSDDEDDNLDTVSEAPSSLISGDLEGDQSEKLKVLKAEVKRLWGKNTRLTKSLTDTQALYTLQVEHAKVLDHTA